MKIITIQKARRIVGRILFHFRKDFLWQFVKFSWIHNLHLNLDLGETVNYSLIVIFRFRFSICALENIKEIMATKKRFWLESDPCGLKSTISQHKTEAECFLWFCIQKWAMVKSLLLLVCGLWICTSAESAFHAS